ncbi:G-box-binding factor 4 [Nymphaea thermarum]|nr:G-box-binding factor 4 [Nymphaea thermarum]
MVYKERASASSIAFAESGLNSQAVFSAELQPPDDPDPSRATAMAVDELMKGSWPAEPSPPAAPVFAAKLSEPKTAEEVWKEIGEQRRCVGGQEIREMTLEDFLAKAGVVVDGGVVGTSGLCGVDVSVGGVEGFLKRSRLPDCREEVVRTKRKAAAAAAALAEPVDRAAQQRQRRMIKNRESAARSRERKLAYTKELVSAVSQLKEENIKLVKEQVLRESFAHTELEEESKHCLSVYSKVMTVTSSSQDGNNVMCDIPWPWLIPRWKR